ncbi:hypothetical protein ACFXTN_039113 [Malus domestica]
MLQKTESREDYSGGNSNNGELLRDIEELRKALYFHKPPPKITVSSDFLNILGMDCSMSSDSDAKSPRERLLREFEKEALGSGNLFFDFDWKEEQPEIGSSVSPGSDSEDCLENSDLSLIIEAAEEEHNKESELLRRRKAKILQGLETEALMREWPRTFSYEIS